ncbi:hypothetical protein KKG66_00325, partial [bacterium]|nr:hypothetical protein [bacterium]
MRLRPAEKIIPYVKAPPEIVPGIANYYASTSGSPSGVGVLIKTREGRPIKLEGNPDHPLTQGKLNSRDQLDIFNLYDPDRLTAPVKLDRARKEPTAIAWAAADAEIAELLKQAAGQIVLLTGTIHGPARKRVIEDFKRAFPGTRHIMYDAWTHEVSRNMQQKCYGRKVLPAYQVDKAEYLLCFESDPLGSGYSATEWQVGFGKNRKVRDGKLNKLVVFDANVTFTGASADERFRIQLHAGFEIAMAIANELAMAGRSECGSAMEIADSTRTYAARSVEGKEGLPEGTISRIARELWRHRGESIVFGRESESLQIAVNLLNSMLGNEGKTIDGTAAPS